MDGRASMACCLVMSRRTNGHVNERESIHEIRYDSCGRRRSSGLVAARLRPGRVAALRHRGRLLSRSRRGDDPLRSRRSVCSPSKPAWRPSVHQRRIWRSSRRRPQGMLPVLLKHLSVPEPLFGRSEHPAGVGQCDEQRSLERLPISFIAERSREMTLSANRGHPEAMISSPTRCPAARASAEPIDHRSRNFQPSRR